jgi:hypothetical protein
VDSGQDWADGEEHELMLTVGESGLPTGTVRFFFDGEQIGVNPYAFESADVVAPFFQFVQAADLTPVELTGFEIGHIRTVERGV